MRRPYAFYKQLDSVDCGPTCLRMVAKHYGKSLSLPYLREQCFIDRTGVSLKGISEAAELIGFRTLVVKIPLTDKKDQPSLTEVPLPSILHWNQNHFVTLYKINHKYAWIGDPAIGKLKISLEKFKKSWLSDENSGVALLLEPTPNFYNSETGEDSKKGFSFLFQYLTPYKKLMFQLILGLLLGTIFQLIFPFLTQSLVDVGIDTNDLNFIYLILIGQLMLFLGQITTQFIQSWILLHISVRINVNLIADFLMKLMRLPLGFFDSKNTGDLLQRIDDHRRIESFLTRSSLEVLLSILNLVVFGAVLIIYSVPIFIVFLISAVFYLSWIIIFLKKRKEIDHRAFQQHADNQDSLIEIIQGMSEIKLQGSELKRRWQWASIQAKLFRTKISALRISQYQDAGAKGITQLKDIFITFLAATEVLQGSMTLGAMLAIQYIIGQLNAPLQQLVGFIRSAQDASISLERLREIHDSKNEEDANVQKLDVIPFNDLVLTNVTFSYTPISEEVLKGIDLTIPYGKTTAIVGTSGSGKTTLIKLLLGFYQPTGGKLMIGKTPLQSIYQKIWRQSCGVVMQDGFIFSDTITKNIAESDDRVNFAKVLTAATKANIIDFVQSLPLGFNTLIGPRGNGISQGQKQRLLIARAIYKNPEFIFFDEATNALDANNERIIMNNLYQFMKGKTSVVVAHRLSTVKNADQIIVLESGKIVERGTHNELVSRRGNYYNLVQNQLELGN